MSFDLLLVLMLCSVCIVFSMFRLTKAMFSHTNLRVFSMRSITCLRAMLSGVAERSRLRLCKIRSLYVPSMAEAAPSPPVGSNSYFFEGSLTIARITLWAVIWSRKLMISRSVSLSVPKKYVVSDSGRIKLF